MSSDATGSKERLHTLSIFGSHWLWLVLLGGVLMLAGAIAILVPAICTGRASSGTCCSASWPSSAAP